MKKYHGVLLGLFAMVSGIMTASAYFSSQQAFISAAVSLDIDFGTVFPGVAVTESFTIDSPDASGYTITLAAPDVAGVNDIRPYLTVEKDPAETDFDGPVSGAPDYTGSGSFSAGDLSDRWLVTFFVPLTKGDYDCKVIITPDPKGELANEE